MKFKGIFGILVFQEYFTLQWYIGAGIIILGVVMILYGQQGKKRLK